MIILVGESASGKSSIEQYLSEYYRYERLISYTTREPRKNESYNKDYHFISTSHFLSLKQEGFFAETGEYNGWLYGSAKEDYKKNTVAVLTPHGLRQVQKQIDFPELFNNNFDRDLKIISFYINVPRRDRLIKVLQRGDNIEEAYRRSLSDVGQFDGIADEVNYIIDNPNYNKSIEQISETIDSLYRNYISKMNKIN